MTTTFERQGSVRVAGLRDRWAWQRRGALTSCNLSNCLIVSDISNVYKVDLSINSVIHWRVDGRPTGLSVNESCHVIVACDHNEIREYKPDGQLVRTISLHESHVTSLRHAVQLTKNQFVVSHHGPVFGVSLIDEQGGVLATYRDNGSAKLLNHPRQLTIGKNGSVLVADCDNNRLVVLDASLRNARDLTLPIDGGLRCPRCLYFNESLGRLYVGEEDGKRVVICDQIIFE